MGFINIKTCEPTKTLNQDYSGHNRNNKSQAERQQDQPSPHQKPLSSAAGTGPFRHFLSRARCTSLMSDQLLYRDREEGANQKQDTHMAITVRYRGTLKIRLTLKGQKQSKGEGGDGCFHTSDLQSCRHCDISKHNDCRCRNNRIFPKMQLMCNSYSPCFVMLQTDPSECSLGRQLPDIQPRTDLVYIVYMI